MSLRGPLAALLAVCALLASCSQTAEPELPPPSPALWEVTGEGGVHGYLFGTVHSLPDDFAWRTELLDRSFDAAHTLVVEVGSDPGSESIFRDLSTSAGLPPLSQRVSPDNRQKLASIYRETGQDDGDFATSESWAAAIQIANAFQAGSGANGVDVSLIGRAGAKRLIELEGFAGQLGIFDKLPEEEQRDMLDIVVGEASGAREHGARMIDEWRAGNIAALEGELSTGTKPC